MDDIDESASRIIKAKPEHVDLGDEANLTEEEIADKVIEEFRQKRNIVSKPDDRDVQREKEKF